MALADYDLCSTVMLCTVLGSTLLCCAVLC